MKILHINNYATKGGAETVFNLTRNNLKDIKSFSAYVKSDNYEGSPDVYFYSWEKYGTFRGIINYIFSYKNFKILSLFLKNNDIDVIHIHGFFSTLSPSILLAIRKIKKKKKILVLQTLHDFHLICPNSSLFNYNKNEICEKCIGKKYKFFIFKDKCDKRGLRYSIIKGIRSFVANNILFHREIIDKFIVPSEFLKKKLLEDNILAHKIVVIRNPIMVNSKNDIKKENIICYFGRFSKEKNLEFLLNSFIQWKKKSRNNFKLVLIGEGESEIILKDIALKSNYKSSIFFKPFMSNDELFLEIKKSKYFSLTSKWYENFPMSIIEAITLNIIPVTPNIGGMQEMIESIFKIGKTYKVGNTNSWIETMNNLEINYTEEYQRLIAKKDEFSSLYGLISYVKKIKEIYNSL